MAKQSCDTCQRWDRENETPSERAVCLWHAFTGPAPEWFDQPLKHRKSGVDCGAFKGLPND